MKACCGRDVWRGKMRTCTRDGEEDSLSHFGASTRDPSFRSDGGNHPEGAGPLRRWPARNEKRKKKALRAPISVFLGFARRPSRSLVDHWVKYPRIPGPLPQLIRRRINLDPSLERIWGAREQLYPPLLPRVFLANFNSRT
ncbi:hypothetical protein X777_06337 [Ooceraea biroi]|uniref:Uncharacterized protein n=1 Tax=Ooceraea biroi TaxID=2015173 RepID=A0A026WBD7_OOCBI|nr:hypothetical protein X777_06337 [Ooceraea biroi]